MIDAVKRVTHIAPPDEAGNIIGSPIVQEGVINYPVKELGLCASARLGWTINRRVSETAR